MTKKHFNALAKAIAANKPTMFASKAECERIHIQLATAVADICAEANPRFNREAFLIACGIHAWALAKEPTP